MTIPLASKLDPRFKNRLERFWELIPGRKVWISTWRDDPGSMHFEGLAGDIAILDYPLKNAFKIAFELGFTGIGVYEGNTPNLHLDNRNFFEGGKPPYFFREIRSSTGGYVRSEPLSEHVAWFNNLPGEYNLPTHGYETPAPAQGGPLFVVGGVALLTGTYLVAKKLLKGMNEKRGGRYV